MTSICQALNGGECMIVCLRGHPPFARHATRRQSLVQDRSRCDPRGNLDCNLGNREASPQATTRFIEYNPRMDDGLTCDNNQSWRWDLGTELTQQPLKCGVRRTPPFRTRSLMDPIDPLAHIILPYPCK